MTDTPWTPGPWEWSFGQLVTKGEPPDPWYGDKRVMYVGPTSTVDRLFLNDADAALIAAAPEMAWFLNYLCDTLVSEGYKLAEVDEARALLARIRGEAEPT